MTRDEKRREWVGVMERWRGSGLSRARFCREQGLRGWQFQYWQRRLAEGEPTEGGLRADAGGGGAAPGVGEGLRCGRVGAAAAGAGRGAGVLSVGSQPILLYQGAVDMRKSFDGLSRKGSDPCIIGSFPCA
jgi:hypothetical protein